MDIPLPLEKTVPAEDAQHVAEVMQSAVAERRAIYPIGAGTHQHYGAQPQRPGWGLDLRRLDNVVDYPARDLTITVEVGMSVARLQEVLSEHRQWLPVDGSRCGERTIGGLIATGTWGPRSEHWGTIRDYLLAFEAVDGTGMPFRNGVRVVKNAAGYYLTRLLVGSLGTLAVPTQATLMVRPKPEHTAAYVAKLTSREEAAAVIDDLERERLGLSAVELLAGPLWHAPFEIRPDDFAALVVVTEGSTAEVEWTSGKLTALARRYLRRGFHAVGEVARTDAALCDTIANSAGGVVLRWHMLRGHILPAIDGLRRTVPGCSVQAQVAAGTLLVHLPEATRPGDVFDAPVRELMRQFGGHPVVERHPPDAVWDRRAVWGPRRAASRFQREIKDRFDPYHVLNPGRFVFSEDAAIAETGCERGSVIS